jgi:DNA repair exonuclease SbcCD nuclease subunit
MKIAILTDTHWGARNDDLNVYQNMREFFEESFFPVLKNKNIKHIIHMGDVFDRRKFLNTQIVDLVKKDILDNMKQYETHIITGNHDCYFTSQNLSNASIVLREYDNLKFYDETQVVDIDGFKSLFIPWINRSNYNDTMKLIEKTKEKIAFGHLEIAGFEFHTGSICNHGISAKIFDKFDKVYSGHFHKKSTSGRITYLGSPYQTTWIEASEAKGFHIFDTETLEMEFIENPNRLFVVIDDQFDFDRKIEGKYVKINVTEEKSRLPTYDVLRSKIEESGAIKVTANITERVELTEEVDVEDSSVDDMDIITISNTYIDALEYSSKDNLKELMASLYREVNNA